MRRYSIALVLALSCAPYTAVAQTACTWSSWAELGQSILESAPEIQRLRSEADLRKQMVSLSSLTPAPFVNAQLSGGGFGKNSTSLEASYLWTLEKAGKLDARQAAAQASLDEVEANRRDAEAKIILDLALVQRSLRRYQAKREVLLETQSTYQAIIRQFKGRPVLGPEQEVTLAVYDIAKHENDLRIEALALAEAKAQMQVALLSGCPLPRLPAVLPARLPDDSGDAHPTIELRLNAEERSLQRAAEAARWAEVPDLAVGPLIQANRSEGETALEFGLALSLTLPGQRTEILQKSHQETAKIKTQEIERQRKQLSLNREAYRQQYAALRQAMKAGYTAAQLTASHKRLEKTFRGERVSAALVIEAHRQMIDHITTYAEMESEAQEALLMLRYLDGKLSWEDL